jgi:phosphoglycerol transferase
MIPILGQAILFPIEADKSRMIKNIMVNARRKIWFWGVLATLTSLVPFVAFQLDPANHSLTYSLYDVSGDTVSTWAFVKAIIEGSVVPFVNMSLPQMAAPFGPLNLSEGFPMPEQLQFLVIKAFGFFSHDPIRVMNLYFLFGYLLTTAAFYTSAIWLGIRPAIAFGLSFAFTYLSYHLVRYHHLALSEYWVLAPAAAIVLKVLDGSLPRGKRTDFFIFGASLLITAWHSYYGYFFCGIYCVTWLIKHFRSVPKTWIRPLLFPVLGFLLAITASTANHFFAQRDTKDHPTSFKRSPSETRYYRLRLHSVLLPTPNHRIAPFAKVRDWYTKSENAIEGTDEAIGFLALAGLALGIVAFLRGFRKEKKPLLFHFGLTQLLILFFASSFGISFWVAALVSPTFRSVNRISPMLAAVCLFAVGTLLTQYLSTRKDRRKNELLATGFGIAIALFAIWDQVPEFRTPDEFRVMVDSARSFDQAIEARVEEGPVLQIPHQAFPEGGPVYGMPDYAHQFGPLFSSNTKWSYGAFKGTREYDFIKAAAENPTDLKGARLMGYAGIWIDRRGYPDRAKSIEAELEKALGKPPLVSLDESRSFFKID